MQSRNNKGPAVPQEFWQAQERHLAGQSKPRLIEVPSIIRSELLHMKLLLVGTMPLIMHKFSKKAMQMILDKQMGKERTGKKDPKDPDQDFIEATHFLGATPKDFAEWKSKITTWRYGFPACGFKAAAIEAVRQVKTGNAGITATKTTGMFHVLPTAVKGALNSSLVEILTPTPPEQRFDMVRLQDTVADVRIRPEFPQWQALVELLYNPRVTSPQQLSELFNVAGFSVGLGEWRPDRRGQNGMFEVAKTWAEDGALKAPPVAANHDGNGTVAKRSPGRPKKTADRFEPIEVGG